MKRLGVDILIFDFVCSAGAGFIYLFLGVYGAAVIETQTGQPVYTIALLIFLCGSYLVGFILTLIGGIGVLKEKKKGKTLAQAGISLTILFSSLGLLLGVWVLSSYMPPRTPLIHIVTTVISSLLLGVPVFLPGILILRQLRKKTVFEHGPASQ